MQHESDEALMARATHPPTFRLLVQRHHSRAYGIAARMLGARQEAEDAVQEAFTKLWTGAPSWQPGKASFSTWFYRIVCNACLDMLRKRRLVTITQEQLDHIIDDRESAEKLLISSQESAIVRAAMLKLPPKQRLAVTLCYFEDYTNAEAAKIMNIHIKALEGLLVRARKQLKNYLSDNKRSSYARR